MQYDRDTLRFNSAAISLRHVEGLEYPVGDDQKIVDALKDDLELKVMMVSGREYLISISAIQEEYPYLRDRDKREIRNAIYDRWLYLLGKK